MDYSLEGLHDDERPPDWDVDDLSEFVERIHSVQPVGIVQDGEHVGKVVFADPQTGKLYAKGVVSEGQWEELIGIINIQSHGKASLKTFAPPTGT